MAPGGTVPAITAEAVAAVFSRQCPRWNPPSTEYCEAIAATLRELAHERADEAKKQNSELKARVSRFRRALTVIGEELPYLLTVVNPAVQPSLRDFQVAFDALILNVPDLKPGAPLRPYLGVLEYRLAHQVFFGLAGANPDRSLGLPRSSRPPVAQAVAALLVGAGMAAEPGAIAKRLARDEPFCEAVRCYKPPPNL